MTLHRLRRSQLLTSRRERGLVASSPSALLSAGAVLLAAALYFVTAPTDHPRVSLSIGSSSGGEPTVTDTDTEDPVVEQTPEPPGGTVQTPTAAVDRAANPIVVLNNSKVSGLAARTAVTLQALGWDVEDSANWVGVDQPTSVVFYPAGLQDAAATLAADLKVGRVEPMPDTMPEKRIAVVLTSD